MPIREWRPRTLRRLWAGALLVQTLIVAAVFLPHVQSVDDSPRALVTDYTPEARAAEFERLRDSWGVLVVEDAESFSTAERDSSNAVLLVRGAYGPPEHRAGLEGDLGADAHSRMESLIELLPFGPGGVADEA